MDEQPSTSRISNGDKLDSPVDKQNAQRSEIYELPRTDSRYPQIVLKVVFSSLLFAIVLGSGFVARITLHILLWHINPPDVSEDSALNTLGGLLQHNCTVCSNIHNSSFNCTSQQETTTVDETWIWAVFLVIVAPYFLTFTSTLFRICLKSNVPIKREVLFLVLVVESIHSIGLTILAFFILPTFDPASASVVYLSIAVVPALLDIIDKARQEHMKGECTAKGLCKDSSRASVVFPLLGVILQLAGNIMIGIYMDSICLVSLYAVSVLCVSVKYWENFIHMGNEKSTLLPRIKFEYQRGRTKVTCIANLWKITLTFIAVIVIFAIRTTNFTAGFKSLFGNGSSMLRTVFGERVLGDDLICQMKIPFILAIVNILCEYLCYKAAKTSCVIYSQKPCFSFPLCVLPVVTPLTLVALMSRPDILKFDSCDLLFSEWCLTNGIVELGEKCMLLIIAFVLLCVSIGLITRHVWKRHGYKHGETARIFVSPLYCGVFIDLSLLLNRRRKDEDYNVMFQKTGEEDTPIAHHPRPKLYACATMWHETANEMTQLLKSIFKLDNRQYRNDYIADQCKDSEDKDDVETFDFEAHIFFDDAIEKKKMGDEYPEVNEYVKAFFGVINETGSSVYGKPIKLTGREIYRTPYETRVEWTLPGRNVLIVHLKNKDKIRHKKRWSQIMYMYYALEWKLLAPNNQLQETAKHTYILALDGDVDFEPEAVLILMRRMKKSPMVGAACGRIHPIGSGPMVWYQIFEYAISHWLQKATEHVLGCVLCSPGCFSLFRGSALLHKNVLETYTKVAAEAKHYVQYDQGEDRWLCTLLLKQGFKVEYCAESDAYTFAPEGFNEFYNQRRRWTPSTMANILDLIVDWKLVTKNNENISFLFIVYQVFLFLSTILTPGTIFLLIFGGIILGFESIPPWLALIINIIPVGVFMIMCLYASSQRQLQFAAILSSIYAIVMVIIMIGVVRDAIHDGFCSMTTIFLLFVACVFVISGILHPKEFTCLIPGLLYFVAIPSMSMLLFLYSIGNLHNVSWGTRETKTDSPEPDKAKQQKHTPEKEETGHFSPLCCICCPTNTYTYTNMKDKVKDVVDKDVKDSTQTAASENNEGSVNHIQGENTEVTKFTERDTDDEAIQKQDTQFATPRKRTREEREKEKYQVYCNNDRPEIDDQEKKFWKKKIKKYLRPLEQDKNKEKAATEALIELRNSVCIFVFLLNAILVTVIFSLTQINAFKDTLSVKFTCGGNDVNIVPISILFAVVFGFLLFIQFICMLYHRISTLIHITAETKIREDKRDKIMNEELRIADFLTNPITSNSTKPELPSDKIREILEIIPEKEEKITSIDAIVDKQMDHLEDVKGTFYKKQQLLAVINKWKNKKTPAMVGVVTQAFPRLEKKSKSNGGNRNKVEPEPYTSSESRCGPPPNGNSQNQEPIGGTDNNV